MDCSAKILLLGKTGAGKSSFINYFLGKQVAKAGDGKPVTMDYFVPYEVKDGRYPIKIYDTKGLETLGTDNQMKEIINGIKEKNNSANIFDWFHTIFYCVSMTVPRFEDFEADFIRKLQKKLTQNIHIILTHCDACNEDNIRHMRKRIRSSLKNKDNLKIFEVVSVIKKKRNGNIAYLRGKEIIAERVFDLLLKDIAHKVSSDYATALNKALTDVAIKTRLKFEQLIDDVVTLKTLFTVIKDPDKLDNLSNTYFDATIDKLEKEFKSIQKHTDRKFNKILQPVIQLYMSYKGVVTNSFDNMGLNFDDILEWSCEDWIKSNKYFNDEKFFMQKILPGLAKKVYLDGSFDEDNFWGILGTIVTSITDLWNLDDRLKELCREIYLDFTRSIPQTSELQQEAYKRIVNFMKQL